MHELALLTGVVRAVQDACPTAEPGSIKVVALRVGAWSGAVPEALVGSWPIAASGTPVEAAELVLELLPAAVWCPACEAKREIDAFFALRCPQCDTPTADLVTGREFEVAYVEVEEPEHA
ncbi:MAG: hydrogenase maturation nickel metallochaperone HypA [Nocardioidaceae bacterium]